MKTAINIEDVKTSYAYKDTGELKRTYFVFRILQFPGLLNILTSCANGIIKYKLPFKFLIKDTVFKIFCAGENINDAFAEIKRLETYKVKSVLDYVSEGEKSEAAFARNTDIIVDNIKRLGKECPGEYASIKITGLEEFDFLKACNGRVFPSDALHAERFNKLLLRIDSICRAASESNVVVFIDAEDRCLQDIFDKITEAMMEKYNKQRAVVFNTLQMYLKDRLEYLNFLIENALKEGYVAGIKLVRGAYVEKERESAANEKRESPVFDTKEQTDASFNKAVELCLQNHSKVETCIASHNASSTLFAIECIEKFGITDHYNKVRFSQLYGMSDNLTFNLAASGFNTSKYLPYGEVEKAIPYLIRRAEENSSISVQVGGELTRLKKEIERRKTDN
ncbi:MAG: proline dehydrogenase family protein [Bacteroidia bacterium]